VNLYEAIFCRKSVRTYTNDEISPEVFEDFRRHYREIPDLFGGMETDFTILDNRKGQYKLLSLFSVRAPYYMAFYSEEAPRCMMNMGCRMEQMVLYLCSKGYGTCFLASTRISHSLQTKGNMVLVGLIAFGISKGSCYRKKSGGKKTAVGTALRLQGNSQRVDASAAGGRKAFSFFDEYPAVAFCCI